jgi:hypothetical protein
MKTFAVIDDNKVIDFVVSTSKSAAEASTEKICAEYFIVDPGWTYVDGVFAPSA